MAVAQQAMAAANDEWERGSSIAGLPRGGGGSPPSIYGGTLSMYGMNMDMPMANMGMGTGMGMGMGVTMPFMFPASPASMYVDDGASVAGSTMGGVAGARLPCMVPLLPALGDPVGRMEASSLIQRRLWAIRALAG